MADILLLLEVNGQDPLPTQVRNNTRRQLAEAPIIYSDESGQGTKEFVLQNSSGDNRAEEVVVTTVAQPYNADFNQYLVEEWSYYDERAKAWTPYANTITINEIPPGRSVRLRTRMLASAGTNPTDFGGTATLRYLQSSIATG